ncbi:ParA family protein [Halobaculum gomorrense]|uniref:Chromosome partitioning protein n=1 Tax=Halobaculum gomorrense TaxID=43928 RepID=A0A1M5UU16_9EURY|nr:ParA family protein [Halobaculum gomorrense]SHH66318.1 chromosome partitioning protein [Halobaculum gomorrense]
MLTYATYSESGGIGKTSLSAALARAHSDNGFDVLIVDMDPQNGDVSRLLGVDEDRERDRVDTLSHHLVDRPQGALEDLVRGSGEGFDILPAHNTLSRLADWLDKAEALADDMGEEFHRHERLFEVLRDSGLVSEYDVLIVDPPATEGPHLYNALAATRNLVVPTELSGKGMAAIEGLSSLVTGFEQEIDTEIGVIAVVPNGIKHTTDQQHYREEIEALGYDVPVIIGERSSLFEGCWRQQCTPFHLVEEHRSRKRDYEQETLEQLRELATFIENA